MPSKVKRYGLKQHYARRLAVQCWQAGKLTRPVEQLPPQKIYQALQRLGWHWSTKARQWQQRGA